MISNIDRKTNKIFFESSVAVQINSALVKIMVVAWEHFNETLVELATRAHENHEYERRHHEEMEGVRLNHLPRQVNYFNMNQSEDIPKQPEKSVFGCAKGPGFNDRKRAPYF